MRTQRLHDLVDKALDNTVSSLGGAAEFARCFAITGDACVRLSERYEDAIAGFQANVKVRHARGVVCSGAGRTGADRVRSLCSHL